MQVVQLVKTCCHVGDNSLRHRYDLLLLLFECLDKCASGFLRLRQIAYTDVGRHVCADSTAIMQKLREGIDALLICGSCQNGSPHCHEVDCVRISWMLYAGRSGDTAQVVYIMMWLM
jgi:hypothetical protein